MLDLKSTSTKLLILGGNQCQRFSDQKQSY